MATLKKGRELQELLQTTHFNFDMFYAIIKIFKHGKTVVLNYNANFLQTHSIKYIEMALRTDRTEKMNTPDRYGKRTGD